LLFRDKNKYFQGCRKLFRVGKKLQKINFMKTSFITTVTLLFCLLFSTQAQLHLRKNGMPDMRYSENKEIFGNSHNSGASLPTFSTPSSTFSTYSTPSIPSYPTKMDGSLDMRYHQNRELQGLSTPKFPTLTFNNYPTKMNGTPDMRYKINKQTFGGF
jgi:hypothetical protein